jgi:co-chaperonin GroES (HSP10)
MERIKDLSKVTLRGDGILAELIEKKSKSGLILPDGSDRSDYADYIKVIAVGNKIEDIKPGYIILDVGGQVETFLVGDQRLALLYRGSIVLAVSPDNINLNPKGDEVKGDINV